LVDLELEEDLYTEPALLNLEKEEEFVPVRDILASDKEFTQNIYNKLLSREDKLTTLLLSDINTLLASIAHDFPEVVKVESIG
jgi:predicted RNA-binding protein